MNYQSIHSKKPSKLRKLLIILAVILGLVLIFLALVGLIASSDSAENQNVSATVAENVSLKQEVADLQQQIEQLQTQIDNLNGELSARPTIAPTPYVPAGGIEPAPTATVVPR